MKYFIDSNVVIDAIRSKSAPIRGGHFEKVDAFQVEVPSIVIAELEYGARHSSNYEKRRNQYLEFIKDFSIAPFTDKEAEAYGRIRQQLTKDGTPIGGNDMLIAATALANGATVVTHNVGEFSKVKSLKVEDWTQPGED
ncbi:MAG: type II toxin-antitoxin system VapC family toxin [Treponema sp.]|nr:type II toxin-antitoxin system VapC family toxin [Treponema sp.]